MPLAATFSKPAFLIAVEVLPVLPPVPDTAGKPCKFSYCYCARNSSGAGGGGGGWGVAVGLAWEHGEEKASEAGWGGGWSGTDLNGKKPVFIPA